MKQDSKANELSTVLILRIAPDGEDTVRIGQLL